MRSAVDHLPVSRFSKDSFKMFSQIWLLFPGGLRPSSDTLGLVFDSRLPFELTVPRVVVEF